MVKEKDTIKFPYYHPLKQNEDRNLAIHYPMDDWGNFNITPFSVLNKNVLDKVSFSLIFELQSSYKLIKVFKQT